MDCGKEFPLQKYSKKINIKVDFQVIYTKYINGGMNMKKIYLYLDESGNFEADASMRDNPSLVGGYLTYDKALTIEEARKICEGRQIHCCEMTSLEFASMALSILTNMKSQGCSFVVFENKERLEIVDGDTTYLNIISEGVVQLMQLLKSRFGSIEFNLIIAQRVAVNRPDYKYRPEGYYISWAEYTKRLQEKIIIGASKTTSEFNIKNWNVEFCDARTDYRLMLSDVVCHSRFRINKKFNDIQKEKLSLIFKEDFIFSVYPSELETTIRKSLVKGNIGEAIFELLVTDNKSIDTKYLNEIQKALHSVNESSRDIQYKMLFSRIINLLHAGNELVLVQSIVDRFRKYFLKEARYKDLIPASFKMDIGLLSLTIATHEGAIMKANNEIEFCMKMLPFLVRRWESVDYYFIFKIRYAVHLINSYDMKRCISEMNQLESVINNTFELFPLADGFGDLCKDIKSDVKGKVFGNRLQARLNLMKTDSTQYELAVIDSDSAMKEFSRFSDLKRQYQYRSRIEYEAGGYKSALKWLNKSIISNDSSDNLEIIISNTISGDKMEAAFTLMHFANIMLLSKEANDNQVFTKIHTAWKRNNVDEYLKRTFSEIHPYEIIYWKIGKLDYMTGNHSAGEEKINIALKLCNKSKDNLTLKAISLGILADKVFLLSSINSNRQSNLVATISTLCSEYESFMRLELPESMQDHFSIWEKQINQLRNRKIQTDYKSLKHLSELVCY